MSSFTARQSVDARLVVLPSIFCEWSESTVGMSESRLRNPLQGIVQRLFWHSNVCCRCEQLLKLSIWDERALLCRNPSPKETVREKDIFDELVFIIFYLSIVYLPSREAHVWNPGSMPVTCYDLVGAWSPMGLYCGMDIWICMSIYIYTYVYIYIHIYIYVYVYIYIYDILHH